MFGNRAATHFVNSKQIWLISLKIHLLAQHGGIFQKSDWKGSAMIREASTPKSFGVIRVEPQVSALVL